MNVHSGTCQCRANPVDSGRPITRVRMEMPYQEDANQIYKGAVGFLLADNVIDRPDWLQFLNDEILHGQTIRDGGEVAARINDWLAANVAYSNEAGERLQGPDVTRQLRIGDCDDFATAAIGMAEGLGMLGRFVFVKLKPAKGDTIDPGWHVYAEVASPAYLVDGKLQWYSLDPCMPDEMKGYNIPKDMIDHILVVDRDLAAQVEIPETLVAALCTYEGSLVEVTDPAWQSAGIRWMEARDMKLIPQGSSFSGTLTVGTAVTTPPAGTSSSTTPATSSPDVSTVDPNAPQFDVRTLLPLLSAAGGTLLGLNPEQNATSAKALLTISTLLNGNPSLLETVSGLKEGLLPLYDSFNNNEYLPSGAEIENAIGNVMTLVTEASAGDLKADTVVAAVGSVTDMLPIGTHEYFLTPEAAAAGNVAGAVGSLVGTAAAIIGPALGPVGMAVGAGIAAVVEFVNQIVEWVAQRNAIMDSINGGEPFNLTTYGAYIDSFDEDFAFDSSPMVAAAIDYCTKTLDPVHDDLLVLSSLVNIFQMPKDITWFAQMPAEFRPVQTAMVKGLEIYLRQRNLPPWMAYFALNQMVLPDDQVDVSRGIFESGYQLQDNGPVYPVSGAIPEYLILVDRLIRLGYPVLAGVSKRATMWRANMRYANFAVDPDIVSRAEDPFLRAYQLYRKYILGSELAIPDFAAYVSSMSPYYKFELEDFLPGRTNDERAGKRQRAVLRSYAEYHMALANGLVQPDDALARFYYAWGQLAKEAANFNDDAFYTVFGLIGGEWAGVKLFPKSMGGSLPEQRADVSYLQGVGMVAQGRYGPDSPYYGEALADYQNIETIGMDPAIAATMAPPTDRDDPHNWGPVTVTNARGETVASGRWAEPGGELVADAGGYPLNGYLSASDIQSLGYRWFDEGWSGVMPLADWLAINTTGYSWTKSLASFNRNYTPVWTGPITVQLLKPWPNAYIGPHPTQAIPMSLTPTAPPEKGTSTPAPPPLEDPLYKPSGGTKETTPPSTTTPGGIPAEAYGKLPPGTEPPSQPPGTVPYIVDISALDLARQGHIADLVAQMDDVELEALIPDPVLRAQVRALVGSSQFNRGGMVTAAADRILQLITSQGRGEAIQDALYLSAAIDALLASTWAVMDGRRERLLMQMGHMGHNRRMIDYLSLKTVLIETLFSKEDLVNQALGLVGGARMNNALSNDNLIRQALDGTTTYEATLLVLAYAPWGSADRDLYLRRLQDTAWRARELRDVVTGAPVNQTALPERGWDYSTIAVA